MVRIIERARRARRVGAEARVRYSLTSGSLRGGVRIVGNAVRTAIELCT